MQDVGCDVILAFNSSTCGTAPRATSFDGTNRGAKSGGGQGYSISRGAMSKFMEKIVVFVSLNRRMHAGHACIVFRIANNASANYKWFIIQELRESRRMSSACLGLVSCIVVGTTRGPIGSLGLSSCPSLGRHDEMMRTRHAREEESLEPGEEAEI